MKFIMEKICYLSVKELLYWKKFIKNEAIVEKICHFSITKFL